LSIIKHVTLQKIVAHDFRYDLHNFNAQLLRYCTNFVRVRSGTFG